MKRLLVMILTVSFVMCGMMSGADTFYFSLNLGLTQPHDFDVMRIPDHFIVNTKPNLGPVATGLSLGFRVFNNFRLEGEFGYKSRNITESEATLIEVVGTDFVESEGTLKSCAFMLNLWYDLPTKIRLVPYIGWGVGTARVALNDFYVTTQPVIPSPQPVRDLLVNDSDWQMAYQASAGLGYKFGKRFMIDLNYQYFMTTKPEFTSELNRVFRIKNRSHNFRVGLRYLF